MTKIKSLKTQKKEKLDLIKNLLSGSFKTTSRKLMQLDGTSFNFTEEFDKKESILTININRKKQAEKEVIIQQFRYKIQKEIPKLDQYFEIYKTIFDYLISTSLFTLNNIALEMQKDEELQNEVKKII